MAGNGNESEGRALTVKFESEDWTRIERAADALADREHIRVTATDIIRSGARRRADEILGATSDAPAV